MRLVRLVTLSYSIGRSKKISLPVCWTYLQVTACLYLVMVVVMVTLNYKLKQTSLNQNKNKPNKRHSDERQPEKAPRSSSVIFKEGHGSHSTLSDPEKHVVWKSYEMLSWKFCNFLLIFWITVPSKHTQTFSNLL